MFKDPAPRFDSLKSDVAILSEYKRDRNARVVDVPRKGIQLPLQHRKETRQRRRGQRREALAVAVVSMIDRRQYPRSA
jgi:hypothetical protein